jgi:hypothetical protein
MRIHSWDISLVGVARMDFMLTLSATVLPEVMGPRARQRGAFLFGPP